MEPTYTWAQIEEALDAHEAKLIKQASDRMTPVVRGVPDLGEKAKVINQIKIATASVKGSIKSFLEAEVKV